jgi:hypothetical protein
MIAPLSLSAKTAGIYEIVPTHWHRKRPGCQIDSQCGGEIIQFTFGTFRTTISPPTTSRHAQIHPGCGRTGFDPPAPLHPQRIDDDAGAI